MRQFKEKKPRIHAWRTQRVDVTRVVKAIGAPVVLYSIDIMGASNTHLHHMWVASQRALLPPWAGRNEDVAFAVIGAGCSDDGPFYQAHISPVKNWGMAWWQGWVPAPDLIMAFEHSLAK